MEQFCRQMEDERTGKSRSIWGAVSESLGYIEDGVPLIRETKSALGRGQVIVRIYFWLAVLGAVYSLPRLGEALLAAAPPPIWQGAALAAWGLTLIVNLFIMATCRPWRSRMSGEAFATLVEHLVWGAISGGVLWGFGWWWSLWPGIYGALLPVSAALIVPSLFFLTGGLLFFVAIWLMQTMRLLGQLAVGYRSDRFQIQGARGERSLYDLIKQEGAVGISDLASEVVIQSNSKGISGTERSSNQEHAHNGKCGQPSEN